MIKIPKDMLIEKIKEKSNISDKELKSKVKDKLDQLSGLISEEGALHIIANELGVKILDDPGELQVKNVLPGMRNVDLKAKVVKIYETREFDKDGRKGKVGNFLIGDETGVMRAVAWNDKADILGKLNENDVVRIQNGYARDNQGRTEIHLGDKTTVTVEKGTSIDVKQRESTRKSINSLKENDDNIEIMGTIVQVFDPRFFTVDPESGKKVVEKEGKFYLGDKLVEKPDFSYVTNLMLDDGTDNIRVVLWKAQTQKLFGMSHDDILSKKDNGFEEIKNELLGKIVKFAGRVNTNEMFARIEFVASLVFTDPDPEEEIKRLNAEIEKQKAENKGTETQEPVEKSKAQVQEKPKPKPAEKPEPSEPEVVKIDMGKEESDDMDLDDIEDLSDLDSI